MKKPVKLLLGFLAVFGLLVVPGLCAALTVDLFETANGLPTGTPSEVGPNIYLQTTVPILGSIPIPVVAGYVEFTDGAKVSDVIAFAPGSTLEKDLKIADHVQLFSTPQSPTFLAGLPVITIPEASFPTIYTPTSGQPGWVPLLGLAYNVYSEPTTSAVPEPLTIVLLGSGIIGLVGVGGRMKNETVK